MGNYTPLNTELIFHTVLKLELLSEVLICDYLTSTLAREMQILDKSVKVEISTPMKPKQRGLLHWSGVLINNSGWAIDSALLYPCSLHTAHAQATPVCLMVTLIAGLDLAPHTPQ